MVSRETSEPIDAPTPPAIAAERYPDAFDGLVAYASVLADAGVVRGLIGPREVPRLWDRHLLNCAVVEELIPAEATVADVGSGAGLPGLVLALVRPDLRITLIESMLRRSTFLQETVENLGLENVEVVRSRVEELPKGARFDVVTSRAVAPLDKLAAWCTPILASQGRILALKGEQAEAELDGAVQVLRRLRLEPGRIVQVGEGVIAPLTTVIEIKGPMRANPAKKSRTRGSKATKQPRQGNQPPNGRRTR